MKRKFFQFRYNNWCRTGFSSARQISLIPRLDVFWDAGIIEDGESKYPLICISCGWLMFDIAFWFNASEELI
jgi:hypothetical protein